MLEKNRKPSSVLSQVLLRVCLVSGFLLTACAPKVIIKHPEPEFPRRLTVAVLPFSDHSISHSPETRGLARTLTDRISERLITAPEITLIDRESIEKILNEQALGLLVSPEGRLQLGKLLGARHFIMGEYSEFFGRLRLDARIVNVETGEIIGSASMKEKITKRRQMEIAFSKKVSNLLLSKVGRFSEYEPVTSLDHFRKGLTLEKTNRPNEALAHYQKAVSLDPENQPARERMEALLILALE